MKRLILLGSLIFLSAGCGTTGLSKSIRQYYEVAPQVQIGDRKADVLNLLIPTQTELLPWEKKPTEAYKENGKTIEIYYFRTGWQADGLVTDDEFVPYVFTDGELTAIGWTSLGGPKTVGQVIQPAPVTNIEVNQEKD
jgi:hypothetical protein